MRSLPDTHVRETSRAASLPALAVPVAAALPVGCGAAAAVALAWRARGSVDASAFLPYGIGLAVVCAVVVLAGAAARPSRAALAAACGLTALAAWSAVSALWAPLPSLARDESLLILLGVVALLLGAAAAAGDRARAASLGAVVCALLIACAGTIVTLIDATATSNVFAFQRLSFPIDYANATASFFLIGLWPAVALAARRETGLPMRAAALGAGSALAATATLAQSKGSVVGLVVSIVLVAALVPQRRRALIFCGAALVPVAVVWGQLTAPYGAGDVSAVHGSARAVVAAGLIGAVLGALLAWLDRRASLGVRAVRVLDRAVQIGLAVVVVAALVGAVVFHAPLARRAHHAWHGFTTPPPAHSTAESHFLELGSNRYDFWRTALAEWRRHPWAGSGARGFDAVYLQFGHSAETPARAHSLPVEVLSEDGLVGAVLALLGYGAILVGLGRNARTQGVLAAGSLGAVGAALGQACVDWTFTFPAVTVPCLLLAGIGLSTPRRSLLPSKTARLAAPMLLAAALLFAVPWLSHRLVQEGSAVDLRWAHDLDPLSVDPLIAQAAAAPTPHAALAPLEAAEKIAPRAVAVRYLLGSAFASAGRDRAAVRELRVARLLAPHDPAVAAALSRAVSRSTHGR